jgi:HEAT repeat protein
MRREPDPSRQSKLIETLGLMRLTAAVEPLMQQVMLNAFQSGPAIRALGNIGDPRAVSVLIQSGRYQNLAWIAKDALVQIGPPAVEGLIAALRNDNPDVRFMAVRALGEIGDLRAAVALAERTETEADETNQQLARTTLKSLLLENLDHISAETRLQAIYGLKQLGDARTIEALQPIADHDPDESVRWAAQETIVNLLQRVETDPFEAHHFPPRSRNTNLLINKFQRSAGIHVGNVEDWAVEAHTVMLLQTIAHERPDEAIRDLTRQTLWALCLDYLRHPDAQARLVAVRGLGGISDPAAIRLLQQIAEYDPNESVRQAAQQAIAPQ